MEGTRQEHILGTCGKETFCGKEQEGEKGSEAGREDKNGGERSGEKEGGERGALQRLGSPWSPVPAGVEFFSTLSWGLVLRDRGGGGNGGAPQEPVSLPWTALAPKLLGWSPSGVGEGQTGAQKQTLPGGLRPKGAPLGAQGEGGGDGNGQGLGAGSQRWPGELSAWILDQDHKEAAVTLVPAGSGEASCPETVTEGGRGGGLLPATSTSTSPPKVKGSQGAETK